MFHLDLMMSVEGAVCAPSCLLSLQLAAQLEKAELIESVSLSPSDLRAHDRPWPRANGLEDRGRHVRPCLQPRLRYLGG
jgi:hypothetical protein